jgi:putative oxidoreductase
LFLRFTVGAVFFGHGAQKLFGWFGGNGLEATSQGFEQLGMRPGRRNAAAAGAAEAGGGAAIALGLATPLSASVLTATMLTAIHRVHLKHGPWLANNGYEYNAILIAAVLGLAEVGPGALSLDHALGIERSGSRWALAALGVGAAGALGAHRLALAAASAPSAPGVDGSATAQAQGTPAPDQP